MAERYYTNQPVHQIYEKFMMSKNRHRGRYFPGRKQNLQNGTATVEASIILPLVMLAILSVLSIIRVTGTYEQVQQSLNQVAEDLSQYSYLYAVSGLKEQHDSLLDNIDNAKNELMAQQEAVTAFYESVSSVANDVQSIGQADNNYMNELFDTLSDINEVTDSYEDLTTQVENILKDPMGEVRLISLALSDTLVSEAKNKLIRTIAKSMLKRRLAKDLRVDFRDLDERMRIQDGLHHMDFSCSTFFDDKETIDLIVEYTVKPMPDFFFLPEIRLRNRACVLAWTWGVDKTAQEAVSDEPGASIWNINKNEDYTSQHYGRGNTAEKLFTEELQEKLGEYAEATPYHFKTVDVIQYAHGKKEGLLITIFSLNPFLPSYQKESAVSAEIKQHLNKLRDFKKAQANDYLIDVSLLEGNYQRVVYIVIPENSELPEVYLSAFEQCLAIAHKMDITLIQVQKYGEYQKNIVENPEDAENEQ